MSTKSTICLIGDESGSLQGEHNLTAHIYTDIHEAEETVVVDIGCSVCYCNYKFLMSEHLGLLLADRIKNFK